MLEGMRLAKRGMSALAALFFMVPAVRAQVLEGPLHRAVSLVDQLDRPVPSVRIETGGSSGETSSQDRTAIGVNEPTTLDRTRGRSRAVSGSHLVVTPGTPAELSVGETIFVGDSPFISPREVFVGRRLRLDGLQLDEDGDTAEVDVEYEDTAPGAGPVVSTGARARTRVRMHSGQPGTVFDTTSESSSRSRGTGGTSRREATSSRRLDMSFEVLE